MTPRGWTRGVLNSSHSRYHEGDFVPFRVKLTGLTKGAEYTLVIGYDAIRHNLHGYDYLGSVDGSIAPGQKILPCAEAAHTKGEHPCSSPDSPNLFPVPIDPNTHFPVGRKQQPGDFSAWGGKLEDAVYKTATTTINDTTIGSEVERHIDVTFKAEGDEVVVAWGGHIADTEDWGKGRTFFSNHSGAPVHMRLLTLNGHSTGNQELGLMARAIDPPPELSTQVKPPSVAFGGSVIDTATLHGTSGVPKGEVEFHVCFDPERPPDCSAGGELVGVRTVVYSAGSNTGLAAVQFVPGAVGHYCFRVKFTPASGIRYSPADETNLTTECFNVTFAPGPEIIPRPTTITVKKYCLPADDTGRFNLEINGKPAGTGANVPCGGTTGPVEVEPGEHTVGETAGSGTNLADYEPPLIGGACAPNGTVVIAEGEALTCTIGNVRKIPTSESYAILTVNKICVPANDSGLFNLTIGEHTEVDQRCGARIGPLAVPVGTQKVGETAGTGTNLADYTTTIGGACAANGSITLKRGQSAICTITNVRAVPPPPGETATLEIKKICVPASETHRFTFQLDKLLLPLMACGQSTGPMLIGTGRHVVSEAAAGTNAADFDTVVRGNCAADGSITLTANEHAVCTVTNARVVHARPAPPPPPRRRPPPVTG